MQKCWNISYECLKHIWLKGPSTGNAKKSLLCCFRNNLVGRAGLFFACIWLQYFLKSHIRFGVWGVLVWDGVRQHWWVEEKSGLKSYLPSTTSQQQIPHCRILQGVRPQRSWAEYHWCANKRATHFGNHNDPGFPSVAQQKADVFHH